VKLINLKIVGTPMLVHLGHVFVMQLTTMACSIDKLIILLLSIVL